MAAPNISVPQGPEVNPSPVRGQINKGTIEGQKKIAERTNMEIAELRKTREYKETMEYLQKTANKIPENEQYLTLEKTLGKNGYKIGIHRTAEGGYAVLLRGEKNPNKFLKVKYQPDGLVQLSDIALDKEGKKVETAQQNPRAVAKAVQTIHEVLVG